MKLATSCDTEVPPSKLLTTTIVVIIEYLPKHLLHAHFTILIHLMFTATLEVELLSLFYKRGD